MSDQTAELAQVIRSLLDAAFETLEIARTIRESDIIETPETKENSPCDEQPS